ncbi:methyltransferase domain-containing protein [Roseovarius sp. SYSU LYC5161]|uniref:methyltransferase domain-containing protein n=1 Tax=Roseovarius halophilus (ex Wu et al. 2025) TaxID=3376060 RepID=UPI002872104D|nr:methyltransferase domain-containing protein [Roseovarius sp.]
MATALHAERFDAALGALRDSGAASVLDLGCGDGDLFLRLAADPGIRHLTGIDTDPRAIDRLRRRLASVDTGDRPVALRLASITGVGTDLAGYDCALMIETIEHVPPAHLSRMERAVFHHMRPATVVVTTPNAEFNPLLGVPAHRFRHPGHRFEWSRGQFRDWGRRVARADGYRVSFADIAGCHPDFGGASQMAVFQAGENGS